MTQTIDLDSEGRHIVEHLGGHWHKGGGMCRCPAHDDRDPSLSVRVGRKTLLFKCFAGCDAVDVIRAINDQRILGQNHVPSVAESAAPASGSSADWRRERALEIWDAARPIAGTPAQRYLQQRGLPGINPELRYLARTPIGTDGGLRYRPALIAAIRDADGFIAIQRTFLDPVAFTKAADLDKPKLALGTPGMGAVRLAPAGTTLGIAEGIETAWSAMMLFGIPVWAALGNERFAGIEIPDTVTRLVLLPDPGTAGERAEYLAIQAHSRQGRFIETRWPRSGDWNDVWLRRLAEGKA